MFPNSSWTVQKLKDKCGELGLKKSGKKDELIQRLNDYLINNNAADNDVDKLATAVNKIHLKKHDWNNMTVAELKAELSLYRIHASGRKEDLINTLKNYFEPKDTFDLQNLRKNKLRILMVAEKPQMAKQIAMYLSPNQRYYEKNGEDIINLQYHDYFKGYPAEFTVTSTFGHVFGYDFDSEVRPKVFKQLFDEKVIQVINDNNNSNINNVINGLKKLARNVDVLILWLDCDLEGESICYEVINIVKDVMNQPPTNNIMDVIFRAKFSAAEDAPKAIKNLIKPNFRYHLANQAKHDLDLKIGVTFSRYQTAILRRKLGATKDIPHISFGPCQTPCFTLCVERYLSIKEFKNETKYYVVLNIDVNGKVIKIKSDSMKSSEDAKKLNKKLSMIKSCNIASVERKDFVKEPPIGLNTPLLLMESSKHYGFGPKETMQVAERLYMKGLISYPRTETTKYPEDVKIGERAKAIKTNHPSLEIEKMDWESYPESFKVKGVDVGDHQPILPTTKSFRYKFQDDELKIYELICRHFMASFHLPCRYHIETVTFDIGHGLKFTRKIQVVDDFGYTTLLPWEKIPETDVDNCMINQGLELKVISSKVTEEVSKPPNPLTESELIGLMEKHRIGTDGSIPGHIENILKRKYVELDEETRQLTPTELGLNLYFVYKRCIPELIKTELRAGVERQLMQIANGEKEYGEVYRYVLDKFKEQYDMFSGNFEKYCNAFESCFGDKHTFNQYVMNSNRKHTLKRKDNSITSMESSPDKKRKQY